MSHADTVQVIKPLPNNPPPISLKKVEPVTQAELYTIELLQKVESPGLNFKVIKNTNNTTGKVDYRAIPCNDDWQRIDLLPIHIAPALEQVQDYVQEQQD